MKCCKEWLKLPHCVCACCRKVFFRKSFEVVDLVVIVLATVMTVAYVIVDDHLINSAVNIGVS